MSRYFRFTITILALGVWLPSIIAQTQFRTDCLEAFRVQLPINGLEYEALSRDSLTGAPLLNYMVDDQYTFWYRLEVTASDTLGFTVIPSNTTDLFQAMLYSYDGNQFCEDLVIGKVKSHHIVANGVFVGDQRQQLKSYRYNVYLSSGRTYYLAVLSLTEEYCGHRLSIRFGDGQIDFHALNKPCYQFLAMDFTTEQLEPIESIENPSLELELPESTLVPESTAKNTVLEPVLANVPSEEALEESDESSSPAASQQVLELEGEIGEKIELEEVYFYNNTFAFRKDSEAQLNDLYQLMKNRPEIAIEIRGHTSGNTAKIQPNPLFKDRGKAWNFRGSSLQLSEKRAEAVKQYLIDRGIKAKRIQTRGMGDSEKIVESPRNPAEHRRNMRVEIAIIAAD